MKKVAFFVTALDVGGIENYLLRFITHYENKIDATVYCKAGYAGVLEQEYLKVGAKIIPIHVGFFNIFAWRYLYNDLKKKQYDSVCDFTGTFAGIIMFLSYCAKIKKRITFYRGSTNHFKEDIFRLSYNNFVKHLVSKYASSILSNSISALDKFHPKRQNDEKYVVIYNGINADKFLTTTQNLRTELSIPSNSFVVGHIGRLAAAKNHDLIIKTAVNLCKKYNDIYFILCGEGVDTKFNKFILNEDLTEQVKLLGRRDDVIKVLNTMDCFYFPSLSEGQPNALIEALIVGLPFVASSIDPIKEAIPEAYHKHLVSIDSVEESSEKILGIYRNRNSTTGLKKWAIEHYAAQPLFDKFYQQL